MKRLLISSLTTVFVVGACAFELAFVDSIASQSSALISEARAYVDEKNYVDASKTVDKLEKLWNDNNTALSVLSPHDYLENIEQTIALMKASIEKYEVSDFWAESSRAAVQTQNLRDTEFPHVGNIL